MPRAENGRKICSRCRVEKPVSEFFSNRIKPDGFTYECKTCAKSIHRAWEETHKAERAVYNQQYNISHREEISAQKSAYYVKHKAERGVYMATYQRNRLKNDPLFKFCHSIRGLISHSFNRVGNRKATKTERILGCTVKEFVVYVESLFLPGMTWENHGVHRPGDSPRWHIDHIIPVSTAKNKKDVIRLCHYTNLRPWWGVDNLKKGSRQDI